MFKNYKKAWHDINSLLISFSIIHNCLPASSHIFINFSILILFALFSYIICDRVQGLPCRSITSCDLDFTFMFPIWSGIISGITSGWESIINSLARRNKSYVDCTNGSFFIFDIIMYNNYTVCTIIIRSFNPQMK